MVSDQSPAAGTAAYEPSRRDKIGVAILNTLAHLLTSRDYRDGLRGVYQDAWRCRLYHDIDITKATRQTH